MLEILPIPALRDNYIWLMKNTAHNCAAIVDPGESEPVLDYLFENRLDLHAILITHHHWDHTGGIQAIVKKYNNAMVYGSTITLNNETVKFPLIDQQVFTLDALSLDFQALSIPGHTLDHTAYYSPGILFTGDTLFTGGCGRLFEGTAEQMLHSLSILSTYPQDTHIYCGHEYTLANLQFAKAVEPNNQDITNRLREVEELRKQKLPTVPSTLEVEQRTNPFLRIENPAVQKAAEEFSQKSLTNSVEIFTAIRQWKNQFKLY